MRAAAPLSIAVCISLIRPPPAALLVASPQRRRLCDTIVASETEDERRRLELANLDACLNIARLESAAEQAEANDDLEGAIRAYEELIELQPPDAPNLREEDAARRALQQLLLESARRELAACESDEECDVSRPQLQVPPSEFIDSELKRAPQFISGELKRAQQAGEESRKQLATRALSDVERIRGTVVRLLELTESQAKAAADKAAGEQAYQRLVDGAPGWVAGWQLAEATRRMDDARILRKSIEADLNRLELQLLQGDPSLAFIREVLASTRNDRSLPPVLENSLWLKEQIASGALPNDPELLRTLLERARKDPDMVVRLVTKAKDGKGKDIYTRRANDASRFEKF